MPYYHQPDHILKSEDFHKSFLLSMRRHQIPGIALAVITNGKISTFEFGVKDSLSQEPVTSSTVFEGASLSKPLIAYAALKLCEKGLLTLDHPLAAYLDDFISIENSRLSVITLRHVLSHTSGFPTANLRKGEFLHLKFDPGSQFGYSGESFRYLGRVIEHITGEPLATYMQEHVFHPLKMKDSSFIWEERYIVQAASPHDLKGQPTEKWKPVRAVASFSLHTTAGDFAKFMIEAGQCPKMLEINVKINESIGWGLGWGIETTAEGTAFWHSGDNGTFQCLAYQRNGRGIVMMTNSANGFKLCREVLNLVIGGKYPSIDWERLDNPNNEPINEDFLARWWKSYDL